MSIEEFMRSATSEQKALLIKLGESAEREQRLASEISRISNSKRSGVYSPDGSSLTVCEDEDDVMVISAEPRNELKRTRNQMKEYMRIAVEIGMAHLGIIKRNYEHYVGKPLPIPRTNTNTAHKNRSRTEA